MNPQLKIRDMPIGLPDRLLLLKTEMGSGHFGASGRYERWKEIAFNYAFILHALGLDKTPSFR